MKSLLDLFPKFQQPMLSALLLLLANMAFGFFLQDSLQGNSAASLVWGAAVAYIIIESSVLSIAWRPTRDFILLGFKSDVGYTMMALAGASFAVVLVVWIKVSSYFFMMVAASLLLRIKLYTRRGGEVLSFIILLGVSLLGLGISWLPTLARQGRLPF